MDLDIKYIIVAVGVLLIVAIVSHHVWRAWRGRQDADDDATAEPVSAAALWDAEDDRAASAEPPPASVDAEVQERDQEGSVTAQRTEPHIAAPEARDNAEGTAESESAAGVAAESQVPSPDPVEAPEQVGETVSKARSVPGARARSSGAGTERPRRTESREETDEAAEREYVAIWVVAKDDERFSGDDLLRAFTDARLEYGARNVFHRRDGSGSQFMVVNGTEPGTFDLAAMSEFSTPAVVATMTLPGPDDPIAAFNAMLTTARALETALGGTLKDEELNAMSYQTIEHCRSRVAEFARRQMSQRQ
ncbi:MAG: cell division protein ZipA [Gammaproteobacteria bacterium]|nr:cell division protein ZipA [Gammaproteobacteria bacterium]MYB37427.1 cell division protein ZipA [Gammaproteobacteria bacterium]